MRSARRGAALVVLCLPLLAGCPREVTPGSGTPAPTTSPTSRFPKETIDPSVSVTPTKRPPGGTGIPIPSDEAPVS